MTDSSGRGRSLWPPWPVRAGCLHGKVSVYGGGGGERMVVECGDESVFNQLERVWGT